MKHLRVYEEFGDVNEAPDDTQTEDPWYEPEDCEYCAAEAEESGIEYEHNFSWKDGAWVCDSCGRYV